MPRGARPHRSPTLPQGLCSFPFLSALLSPLSSPLFSLPSFSLDTSAILSQSQVRTERPELFTPPFPSSFSPMAPLETPSGTQSD